MYWPSLSRLVLPKSPGHGFRHQTHLRNGRHHAGKCAGAAPRPPGNARKIRPAAHGVTVKSFSNMKSLLAAALQNAGVIESLGRGRAKRDGQWGPLLETVADDQRLSNGLATFANWSAGQSILPDEVDDAVVQGFRVWLEAKTLYPKPRDLVRGVPRFWNEASTKFSSWPEAKLTTLSFKAPPKRLQWSDLSPTFQQDADAYLESRANPDLFDERPKAPKRPLATTTLRQQREHLRLAASILAQNGEVPSSLNELVSPERFKIILRYYHNQANCEPNAFVIGLAKTLIQVAQYHASVTSTEVAELKRIAGNLPTIPFRPYREEQDLVAATGVRTPSRQALFSSRAAAGGSCQRS